MSELDSRFTQRRQWGTERNMTPLSNLHEKPTSQKIALSRIAVVLTVLFWLAYVISTVLRQLYYGPTYGFTLEAFGYLIVVTFLTFSSLMYLVARAGALQRFAKHVRVPRAVLDKHFATHQSPITVLVPSYAEETEVIRKTLLSAALQEYPDMRIVLLVDDDYRTTKPEDMARLLATRQLAKDIQSLLDKPYKRFSRALQQFEKESSKNEKISAKLVMQLADNYRIAAQWLSNLADREKIEDHVDVFFETQVLRELAKDLRTVQMAIMSAIKDKAQLSKERVHQLYRRLVWIFATEIEVFERKQYACLSHEASKAMNLNSYMGLMGGSYKREQTPDGFILLPARRNEQDKIMIPDSEFILTLDADSILLRDYCLRLVYFLQQSDNAKVAVTQTPYSSFRGASTRIERLSGATTDIQHILHQGMSYYGATFWVGANAVIRKSALEDIVEKEWIGGFEIKRYIQDSTVIEDTDSSIDLAIHGWKLVNYPERLSYSATPPDFGSLLIQRRRWANGGLLIIPKLWTEIRSAKHKLEHIPATEVMLRLNYMASIAWANFGLVFLLIYPYDGRLLSPFVLMAALPYFMAMASDLKYCRYKYSDIIRIYGFNLILLPVNLAGVLKSIEQAFTTKKMPFARTPKVKDRTAASLMYVTAPLFIVGFSLFTLWRNIISQNWGNAILAGFNAYATASAIVAYIGIGNLLTDIWLGLTELLYVDMNPKNKNNNVVNKRVVDWKSILYHGDEEDVLTHSFVSDLMVLSNNYENNK